MTAPDSRDSVAMRLLNDLHLIASQGETPDGDGVTVNVQLWAEKWADRLQALARGPQQAGGEDVERLARWLDAKYARHREEEDEEAATMLRALQAEVARLREAGRPVGYVYSEIVEVEGTEPVRIKRVALQGEYAQSLPNGTALYAALNGGQDDA